MDEKKKSQWKKKKCSYLLLRLPQQPLDLHHLGQRYGHHTQPVAEHGEDSAALGQQRFPLREAVEAEEVHARHRVGGGLGPVMV